MFDALRVLGLTDQIIITDLGKINVICGKNNSGKSTLLRHISKSSLRTPLISFNEQKLERLYEAMAQGRPDLFEGFDSIKDRIFPLLINRRFPIERDEMFLPIRPFFDELENPSEKFMYMIGYMDHAISQMNQSDDFMIIPPKRTLDIGTAVNLQSFGVKEDGLGLSNYLFFAKNQREDSYHWRLFHDVVNYFGIISGGYKISFSSGGSNVEISLSTENSEWRPLSEFGLGLQDLIVMIYFALSPTYPVILLEEPESHLHPEIQRKLLSFFKNHTNKQFFITTHSNIFLDSTLVDRFILTRFDNGVKVQDVTTRSNMLNELGYTVGDNLISDLIILVEGPSDKPIIEEFILKMGLYDLFTIKIWPLGGDIMDQLDLSVFSSNYRIIALIDNDPKSSARRDAFIRMCESLGIYVKRLQRYSIENYFTIEALRSVFGSQIPKHISEIKHDVKLEEQIGINVKRKNWNIAKKMKIEDIRDTDLYDFFMKVKEHLDKI